MAEDLREEDCGRKGEKGISNLLHWWDVNQDQLRCCLCSLMLPRENQIKNQINVIWFHRISHDQKAGCNSARHKYISFWSQFLLTKSVSWFYREVFPSSFFYGDSVEASNFVQLENHECLFQSLNFTLQVKLILILTPFLLDSTFLFCICFILSVEWDFVHDFVSQSWVEWKLRTRFIKKTLLLSYEVQKELSCFLNFFSERSLDANGSNPSPNWVNSFRLKVMQVYSLIPTAVGKYLSLKEKS